MNYSFLPLVNSGLCHCRRTGGRGKHQQDWIHLGKMQNSIPEKNNSNHKNSVHKDTQQTAVLGVNGKRHDGQKSVTQHSRGKKIPLIRLYYIETLWRAWSTFRTPLDVSFWTSCYKGTQKRVETSVQRRSWFQKMQTPWTSSRKEDWKLHGYIFLELFCSHAQILCTFWGSQLTQKNPSVIIKGPTVQSSFW